MKILPSPIERRPEFDPEYVSVTIAALRTAIDADVQLLIRGARILAERDHAFRTILEKNPKFLAMIGEIQLNNFVAEEMRARGAVYAIAREAQLIFGAMRFAIEGYYWYYDCSREHWNGFRELLIQTNVDVMNPQALSQLELQQLWAMVFKLICRIIYRYRQDFPQGGPWCEIFSEVGRDHSETWMGITPFWLTIEEGDPDYKPRPPIWFE